MKSRRDFRVDKDIPTKPKRDWDGSYRDLDYVTDTGNE